MTDITVLNADGDRIAVPLPLEPGRAAAAASKPFALCTEDKTSLDAISTGLATTHADLVALEALLPAAFAANGGLKTGHPDVRPVSGTITTVDSGSSSASGQNSVSIVTGSPSANSTHHQAINGQSTARVQVSGTWTGTLTFEGSMDGGTTYVPQTARVTGTVFAASSVTANGMFTIDTAGLTDLRVRATAAMTGTATVQMALSTEAGFIQVTNPQRLVDNVSGASATIKPASTAPATTDTAVVTGIADGNHVTFGSKTDNKSTATDATAITAMQVLKQISFCLQALATGLAGTRVETTVAAGGTAANLFGATPTNGFEVINPHATETLYIRENGAATVADNSTSVAIPPKAAYATPHGYKPTGDVSFIATTTGHAVIARRW